jgi:hypothetical protein
MSERVVLENSETGKCPKCDVNTVDGFCPQCGRDCEKEEEVEEKKPRRIVPY